MFLIGVARSTESHGRSVTMNYIYSGKKTFISGGITAVVIQLSSEEKATYRFVGHEIKQWNKVDLKELLRP